MANQQHTFKHRDVVRVVKAAKAAGIDASKVTVDPNSGAITVGPAQDRTSPPARHGKPDSTKPAGDGNEWDTVR